MDAENPRVMAPHDAQDGRGSRRAMTPTMEGDVPPARAGEARALEEELGPQLEAGDGEGERR